MASAINASWSFLSDYSTYVFNTQDIFIAVICGQRSRKAPNNYPFFRLRQVGALTITSSPSLPPTLCRNPAESQRRSTSLLRPSGYSLFQAQMEIVPRKIYAQIEAVNKRAILFWLRIIKPDR